MVKKIPLKKGFKGWQHQKKTDTVYKVMSLYEDGYNAPSIAKITGIARSYVYRIIEKARAGEKGDFSGVTSPFSPLSKNVHALRVRAYVHHMSKGYKQNPNVFLDLDGVSVQCQGRFILLSSGGVKHYGETENKALWASVDFWRKVLIRLESRLGVVIFKKGAIAYEYLYHEYETSDSVVARDAEERGHRWRVFHSEDGKLRLSVDWSDGRPNHETHHKIDAHADSVTFDRFVNGVLNHPDAPGIPEIAKLIYTTQKQLDQTAAGLNSVVQLMKPKEFEGLKSDLGGVPYYIG